MIQEIGEARDVEVEDLRAIYHKAGNPMVEARFIADLIDRGKSQADVAKLLDVTPGHVSKRLRLMNLTPDLQEKVENGEIHSGAAYALARLPEKEQRKFHGKQQATLKAVMEVIREHVLDSRIMTLLEDRAEDPKVEQASDVFWAVHHEDACFASNPYSVMSDESLAKAKQGMCMSRKDSKCRVVKVRIVEVP